MVNQIATDISEFDLENFKPFLGRLVVETLIDEQDVQKHMRKKVGLSDDSPIQLVAGAVNGQTGQFEVYGKNNIVPMTRGRIVIIGDKSFGERFEKWYGKDAAEEGRSLKVGDLVQFVENQKIRLDQEGRYFMISDEHILGYIKVNKE